MRKSYLVVLATVFVGACNNAPVWQPHTALNAQTREALQPRDIAPAKKQYGGGWDCVTWGMDANEIRPHVRAHGWVGNVLFWRQPVFGRDCGVHVAFDAQGGARSVLIVPDISARFAEAEAQRLAKILEQTYGPTQKRVWAGTDTTIAVLPGAAVGFWSSPKLAENTHEQQR
jgi:hypothetical protein